jgi:uncharacterized protein YggU (UPF0235/DUF167 family)
VSGPDPFRPAAEGLEVAVRVTPRGGRDAIEGVRTDAGGTAWLQVRVRAAPEGGRANEAVVKLLAKALGVPPSAVELIAGGSGRNKRLLVRGDPVALRQRAVALRSAGGPERD